ncbi:MAG: hypothetical protein II453_09210 [Alphaproteobacteria bacterium]|nr:hypothetical protein [Alphaproteobacteria bacterium]
MKKSLLSILCLLSIAGYSQDYYWYQNEKIPLERGNQLFIIYEDDFLKESDKQQIIHSEDVFYDEIPNLKWGTTKPDAVIEDMEHVHYHTPSYIYTENFDNIHMFLTHQFYVKLKSKDDVTLLQEMTKQYQVEIVRDTDFANWYVLRCKLNPTLNALQLANLFHESGLFAAAEPEFLGGIILLGLPQNSSTHSSAKNKVIKDGKLFIISGDKTFTPTGAAVR